MGEPAIKTEPVFPPIPTRRFDYRAWYDGDDEQAETGYGETEEAAKQDLITHYPRSGVNCPKCGTAWEVGGRCDFGGCNWGFDL